MSIEIREIQAPDNSKSNWQNLMSLLRPVVNQLPHEEDRDYFKGILGLLIEKEPRMSNIPKPFMFLYIRKARRITRLYYYREIISMEYIRRELINFLNELALSVGEEGLLIKYGIGGFQQSSVSQRVIQETPEPKKKGWLW